MKKVEELGIHEVIHCATEEKAIAICKLMDKAGFTWAWNERYTRENKWYFEKENTCYRPKNSSYASVHFYKEKGYKIYPASDFLEPDFEWGEEIEVSVDNVYWHKKIFVGLNPKSDAYKFVIVSEKGVAGFYEYARKIQQAKPISEYTMEQLIERIGHEFKIKK